MSSPQSDANGLRTSHGRPLIFMFDDYRKYLSESYSYMSQRGLDKMTFYKFSQMAGFRSHNMMKLVIDGKRNLSSASVQRIGGILKLSRQEVRYFNDLVSFNQAKAGEEKRYFAGQIVHSKYFAKFHPLAKAKFRYLSHWYYVAIRELASLASFKEDPRWIATQLRPQINEGEARTALIELLQLGLLRRNDLGRIEQTQKTLDTDDELTAPVVPLFHRQMIQLSLDSVERFPRDKRNLSSVTMAVAKDKYAEICKLIYEFRKQILSLADGESKPEQVFQLAVQLYPLSADPDEEKA